MRVFFLFFIIGLLLLIPVNAYGQVPEWVKNISLWWAEGKISEDEFLSAIKYLLEQKIIEIKTQEDGELIMNAVLENEWKMHHFKTLLDFRSDMVVLLADTVEFQAFTIMLEMKKYQNIEVDEQLIKDNLVKRFIDFASFDPDIDQIRILDLTGMEILRINKENGQYEVVPDGQLQDKSHRYYFHEVLKLKPDEIYISQLDLNEESGRVEVPHKPTIRMGTKIHDIENNKVGFLIVNYNMQDFLNRYSSSNICNTIMFDEDGEVVLHPNRAKMFGKQLGHNFNYYDTHPEILEIEEQGLDWFVDAHEQTTYVIHESEPHGSEKYWHIVCELK
ncbi:cache domain-containing protein [Nitrosopumilus sp.]|uniref:cache domain-containing protein n=1 Tax=Nitrosopumilus sp. TaxID=2024843 RepID=UPI003D0A4D01